MKWHIFKQIRLQRDLSGETEEITVDLSQDGQFRTEFYTLALQNSKEEY